MSTYSFLQSLNIVSDENFGRRKVLWYLLSSFYPLQLHFSWLNVNGPTHIAGKASSVFLIMSAIIQTITTLLFSDAISLSIRSDCDAQPTSEGSGDSLPSPSPRFVA